MYKEDELLPISGLTHFAYCERRAILVLVEQQWHENKFTAEGQQMHEHVHSQDVENRKEIRTVCGLKIHSLQLGLTGVADIVEFEKTTTNIKAISINGSIDKWMIYPVEYKRGKPDNRYCDEIQLCAQAICLEEMLHAEISEGALYYGTPRRRVEIKFDNKLRSETSTLAKRLHETYVKQNIPKAVYAKHCDNCSLVNICMPHLCENIKASAYIDTYLDSLEKECDETTS